MTTWQNKVLELEERGWSLTGLAKATGASIGAISDLKQGRTKEPRANVALLLHELHSSGVLPGEGKAGVESTLDPEEHRCDLPDTAVRGVVAKSGELQVEGATGLHAEQHRRTAGLRA